jgi:hypothetical protein
MYDTDQVAMAALLDSLVPGWVVVWSAHRREHTAFSACTPQRLIIDDPVKENLIDRMRDAQLAALAALLPPPVAPTGQPVKAGP